jgi:hypothetical protein
VVADGNHDLPAAASQFVGDLDTRRRRSHDEDSAAALSSTPVVVTVLKPRAVEVTDSTLLCVRTGALRPYRSRKSTTSAAVM